MKRLTPIVILACIFLYMGVQKSRYNKITYDDGAKVLFSNDGPYGVMTSEVVTSTVTMNVHSLQDWIVMTLLSLGASSAICFIYFESK